MLYDTLTDEEKLMPVYLLWKDRKFTEEEIREMNEEFAKRPLDYLAPDLEELHQQRVAYSAQFNYDIDLICDDIQRKAELRRKNEVKVV